MFANKKSLTVSVLMIFLIFGLSVSGFAYSGGSGTESDPYEIASTDDLIELSNTPTNWGAYFIQTADIEFDADEDNVDWNGDGSAGPSEGFSPIGSSYSNNFTGSYDGQEHTIKNLYIDRTFTNGFFGYIKGAEIEDLGLVDVTNNS